MAKTENAFAAFDFTKMMKDFDVAKMDMSKMFKDFKFPGVDVEKIFDMHRRNFEAVSAANQVAAEGMQTLARRQAEILRQAVEEANEAVRDMMAAQSPEQNAAKQAELAKQTLERAIGNMRELAELAAKSNNEAFEVINKRVLSSIDEIKELLPKQK
ncbi:MAG: phasin family protein [Alphaproteobacteria bacterium]|nr:phasin family protein [Alphaproteobacteria bacterium]